MKRTSRTLILSALMATVASVGLVDAATRLPRSGAARTPSVEAVAALRPVGGATGWGRVKIEERREARNLSREAELHVFGLEPASWYVIEVDGVRLAQLFTDNHGDATAKVGSSDDSGAAMPTGVPAVATVRTAAVLDESGAFVLDGSFETSSFDDGAGSSIHEERITLDPPAAGSEQGMAKVERTASGAQEFDTRATGLPPATSFRIVVDGFLAGVVTSDMVGQARLHLEAPDDTNPLPLEMQPVESLRRVEWSTSAGSLVISGSFTGVSAGDDDDGDESIEGFVLAVGSRGFELLAGTTVFSVTVTEGTVWEHISGLEQLLAGDVVEVEGAIDGSSVVAARVERRGADDDGGDDDVHTSIEGDVRQLLSNGFELLVGASLFQVTVDAATLYEGLGGLAGISVGMRVEAEGELDGVVLRAERVALDDEGGDDDGGGDDGGGGDDDDGDDRGDDNP